MSRNVENAMASERLSAPNVKAWEHAPVSASTTKKSSIHAIVATAKVRFHVLTAPCSTTKNMMKTVRHAEEQVK